MQLEWIEADPTDAEGEKYHVYYLIDAESDQCFATIANPRKGSIIFATDLRIRGYDRSFITIEAAKGYCEWSAMKASFEDAKELAKEFDLGPQGAAAPPGETPAVLIVPVKSD